MREEVFQQFVLPVLYDLRAILFISVMIGVIFILRYLLMLKTSPATWISMEPKAPNYFTVIFRGNKDKYYVRISKENSDKVVYFAHERNGGAITVHSVVRYTAATRENGVTMFAFYDTNGELHIALFSREAIFGRTDQILEIIEKKPTLKHIK